MNTLRLLVLACAAWLAFALGARAAESAAIDINDVRGELAINYGGKRVLAYAFAKNQFKPYVRELYAPNGLNVVRDAPADHLHHHGLMYAIRVNGTNFWEEVNRPGHEVSVKLLSHGTGKTAGGLPQARFSQLLHWVAHTNAELADTAGSALLIETRTLAVTINPAANELALDWSGDFVIGPAAERARLHGSSYNGLGLRLPKEFDLAARHQNSGNVPYSPNHSGDVTAARWSAVTGTADGKEATVTLFAWPPNAGEARFFTMVKPFAYLAVTQNLDKQPLDYARGDKFNIRYLVTVHSGAVTPENLNQRHARWLNDAGQTK